MRDAISNLYDRAVARFGALGVSRADYALRVMQACRMEDLARLHGDDLYLATACAHGLEAGWLVLEREYRPSVREWCAFYLRSWHEALDLADQVWASLFLPGRAGQPRIGLYNGLCSLATWLRGIVIRRVINHRKKTAKGAAHIDPSFDLADDQSRWEPGASFSREFEPVLNRALRMVCQSLDSADCRRLVWRFDEGLALGEIARRAGVHQSTVTRRIDRICERIRDAAAATLASQRHISQAQVEEYLRYAGSGEFPGSEVMAVLRQRAAQTEGLVIDLRAARKRVNAT